VPIVVTNHPPEAPRIEEPATGATFYAGQQVGFRVRATDREDGYLSGNSLVWSSSLEGGLGTGVVLRRALSRTGEHTITLTATDRSGSATSASVRITVSPRPAGNTPPTVTITTPPNLYAFGDNICVTFVAEASDLEDGALRGSSLTWSDQYHDGSATRTRDLGTGERIDVCNLPAPSGDTRHAITVTATDSDGAATSNSLTVTAIPGGLI
jgi:hypothetical protein